VAKSDAEHSVKRGGPPQWGTWEVCAPDSRPSTGPSFPTGGFALPTVFARCQDLAQTTLGVQSSVAWGEAGEIFSFFSASGSSAG
jgi:hypothetical protein